MSFAKTFQKAILAGIAISLGGYVFLNVGGLTGAVLFTFGLLTVVHYQLALFTGKAGYFNSGKSIAYLFSSILIGNVVGCFLVALLAWPQITDMTSLQDAARKIVDGRLNAGYMPNFLLAIPCGFIMTTAVEFGRQQKFLPLLFGVPLFIMCGFRHSIADAYYYLAANNITVNLFLIWIVIVLGNFIGCNLYRFILIDEFIKTNNKANS